jgi:hypothetical protein
VRRVAVACAIAVACSSQDAPSGLLEPVRVRGGQFIDGDLPGTPPGVPGPGDLRVTNVSSASRVALPGQGGKKLEGRASARASAMGVRFADIGSGYWVFPLGAADPQFPGELAWSADLDFALEAAADHAGFHPLRVVAIDEGGAAGEQSEVSYCLASLEPDNLSSCDPKTPPPDLVVSLFWDAHADLDLRVALPNGRTVDPKHPLSDPDAGAADPNVASFTRDSLASCIEDGRRQEDLVFPKGLASGSIDLYVQLFDPCGSPAAGFTVVVLANDGGHLVERMRQAGRVVATSNGNESEQPPLYVASYP